MDSKTANDGPGISLADLNAWLGYQLDLWQEWATGRDESWLALESGNESFPTLGDLFAHAFTPLHRYSDKILGSEPHTGEGFPTSSWIALSSWAGLCTSRHKQACESLSAEQGRELLEFTTRSAGVLKVTQAHCLSHAASHCAWHLGGIAHLVRAAGQSPPQRSDFIFWAASLHRD